MILYAEEQFHDFTYNASSEKSSSTHSEASNGVAHFQPAVESLPSTPPVLGRCSALYDYDANLYDELTIRQGSKINLVHFHGTFRTFQLDLLHVSGDEISIYAMQDNDWWHGELRGKVGIFPATYVKMVS